MAWRDLIARDVDLVTLPWTGGRALGARHRHFRIEGRLPVDVGWYVFELVSARRLRLREPAAPDESSLGWGSAGYLVGDRFLTDDVRVDTDPAKLITVSERAHLVEVGLGRFTRVSVGRVQEGGPLIFRAQEMPLGPEPAVLEAYLEQKPTLDGIPCVSPALDAAFRFETWRRAEAERRRRAERERLEHEAAQRALEEQLAELRQRTGTATARRALAAYDFSEAARAALAVGGAEYLDSWDSCNRGEKVVAFRFERRRFECTCDARTLRIIDAGICLTDHETGESGDARFTLESFPSVIREAIDGDKLVVFRLRD